MAKKKDLKIVSCFKMFFEGLKLYFLNIDKFLGYMSFPVLAQVVGVFLIFGTLHLYAQNVEKIVGLNPVFDNIALMMLLLLVLIIPSFMLFFAGFWKYMVAFGALNSMASNLIAGAKLEDLKMHNDIVTRRTSTFIGVLLLLSVISIIGICPLLWVVLLVFMVYLCLVFQVFAFEENLNCVDILRKSVQMVKGNFLKVTLLLVILWVFTYWLVPNIFNLAFERMNVLNILAIPINAFCQNLPLQDFQTAIQSFDPAYTLDIDKFIQVLVKNIIGGIIIGYTLPLRSICCTLLYKNLETQKLKEKKIKEL